MRETSLVANSSEALPSDHASNPGTPSLTTNTGSWRLRLSDRARLGTSLERLTSPSFAAQARVSRLSCAISLLLQATLAFRCAVPTIGSRVPKHHVVDAAPDH